MSEKRLDYDLLWNNYYQVIELDDGDTDYLRRLSPTEIIKRLNEQQELIEELQVSDEMGWKRAEKFEKELKQKKIYIKRLEYKVQKFKEENEQLRKELKEIKENPINYF